MKQFVRHIFLLVAILVATANAWAEWPEYKGTIKNVSGRYYVVYDEAEDELSASGSGESKDYNFGGPGEDISFQAMRSRVEAIGNLTVTEYTDNTSLSELYNANPEAAKYSWGTAKEYKDPFGPYSLNRSANRIVFKAGPSGSYVKKIKNIKVPMLSYMAKTNLTSWTADTAMIGAADETKQVTVDWSNTSALTCEIKGTGASQFSCTITNNASAGKYGTATLTITYKHKEVNTHNATLILSNGETIPLTGTTLDKYDAVLDWTIANVDNSTKGEYHVGDSATITDAYTLKNKTTDNAISLPLTFTIKTISRSSIYQEDGDGNYDNDVLSIEDEELKAKNAGVATITASFAGNSEYKPFTKELTLTINKHDVNAFIIKSNAFWNEKIENAFYLSDDFAPFIVGASSDPKIATYDANANQIQTYFTSGTVTFQISRPENYKYKELKSTSLTLDVSKNDELSCFIVTDEECDIINTEGAVSEFISLNGAPGDVLTFKYRINSGTGTATWMHYITPLYSTNGSNFNPILKEDGSEYRFETKWLDDPDESAKVPLPQGTTHIQFKRTSNNSLGNRSVKISDIDITRKAQLEPQIEDDKFYLSQSSSGMNFSGSFILNWSTCASEIRLVCENPLFEISHTIIDASSGNGSVQIDVEANMRNASALTGELTIYDQSQKKIITLSCEHLLQQIHWTQYFNNLEATEEGVINEEFILDAVAKDVNGNLTNQPINYTLNITKNAENARVENGVLYITGVCEGSITASVEGFTKDGKTYSSDAITHDIRVRKAGEPCNTVYSLKDRIELNTIETSEPIYVGDKNPDKLRFIAHRDITAANYFYVVYSTNGGSAWADLANPMLPEETDTQYEYTLPDNTTHVRFETRTGATWKKYVKNIEVTQKSYLNVDPSSISETIYVNTPFSKEITVQYSDIPLIQSELTKNTTDNLYLYPHQSVNNNCGQYGEYTFTLLGEWEEPQTIQETIRFFTSAGDEKLINIKIDVITNTQITSQAGGDWNNPSSWFPNIIPTASHPVIIKHAIEVSSPAEAYGVVMTQGAHINIASTGGLTVHAGGYTPLNKNEEDLEITIDTTSAGYFRMSPLARTDMPKAQVNFTTKGTLNGGGNDAAYQYIGAPGEGVATDILGTTVLYLRSEEKGWVRLKTFWAELEAFAGYALTQKAQPEFTFYPQLINGDKIIQLTYTPDGMKGDNLWANSYMAPLDITKFTPDDFTGNVTRTFYLYNSGSYDQWKNDTSSVSTAGEVPGRYYAIPVLAARALGDEAQTVVPPMQGVYMKAGEGGGEIKLSYEKHVWNNTQTAQMNKPLRIAGRNESAEKQNPDFQRVRLQVTSENSGADRMYIIQDSLTTSGYDNGYDAPKQMADNLMNMYTNEPFGKMEISSTNNMDGMYIGFKAGDDSEYTMTFSSLIGDSLYLYDMEADEYIEMTENGQYQFLATPMSTNDLRFQLLVAPDLPDNAPEQGGDVATMIENLSTTKLWISDKMVYVTNVQPNSTLAIYGLGGICVAQYQIPEGMKNVQYPISNLPVGVYIIRLNDQACKFVCK